MSPKSAGYPGRAAREKPGCADGLVVRKELRKAHAPVTQA
jgi:hypothetical protein